MAYQTGKSVIVSYKPEVTFNTPLAVFTGAKQFRLNSGAGLKLGRTEISSNEVRSDGQTGKTRLGSKTITGSYDADLSVGTFDDLMEAVLRGTWATGVLLPGVPPVRRSFVFEEYEQDIDVTTVYTGCRVSMMKVSLTPDGMVLISFGIVGADGELLSTGAAPFFTSPTVTTSIGLVAVDAVITLDGDPNLDFTSCEFTVDLRAAGQSVIGSLVTPDVFESNMQITGSLSALRKDAAMQASFLAETEANLVLVLSEPAPGTGSLTFTVPLKFTDYSKNLGGDGAMVATLPFTGFKDTTLGGMIKIETENA